MSLLNAKERDIVAKALQDSENYHRPFKETNIPKMLQQPRSKKCSRQKFLILSATANMGLTENQTQMIDQYCERLACSVKTIEDVGAALQDVWFLKLLNNTLPQ